jgi:hypothetical protein
MKDAYKCYVESGKKFFVKNMYSKIKPHLEAEPPPLVRGKTKVLSKHSLSAVYNRLLLIYARPIE